MKTEDFTDALKVCLGNDLIKVERLGQRRLTVIINPAAIVDITRFLHVNLGFRFIIASAMHTRKGIEILYHFSDDSTGNIINVSVVLDEKNTEIESLTGVFTAADWIEREMHEILGINFLNHPNLDKLLSDGNWAEGVYPYRKTHKPEAD